MSEVGREVRRRREVLGWSQAKLAVEAGMAVSAVSQIENGHRRPSAGSLEKLSRAFGLEVGDLFPKASVPLFDERPSEASERRARSYPYDWMADAFAKLIDLWEAQIDKRDSPSLSRQIARQCQLAADAITRAAQLKDTWGSGQLTHEEFEQIRPEYHALRAEWWELEDRLFAIARKGLEHYEEASKEALAADEVRELRELQERRTEARHRTREIKAERSRSA